MNLPQEIIELILCNLNVVEIYHIANICNIQLDNYFWYSCGKLKKYDANKNYKIFMLCNFIDKQNMKSKFYLACKYYDLLQDLPIWEKLTRARYNNSFIDNLIHNFINYSINSYMDIFSLIEYDIDVNILFYFYYVFKKLSNNMPVYDPNVRYLKQLCTDAYKCQSGNNMLGMIPFTVDTMHLQRNCFLCYRYNNNILISYKFIHVRVELQPKHIKILHQAIFNETLVIDQCE